MPRLKAFSPDDENSIKFGYLWNQQILAIRKYLSEFPELEQGP